MRGEASTRWLCLHLVKERPSTSTRPCISEPQALGEVGHQKPMMGAASLKLLDLIRDLENEGRL